jgi:hypothetical protein
MNAILPRKWSVLGVFLALPLMGQTPLPTPGRAPESSAAAAPATQAAPVGPHAAVVNKFCTTCHNDRLKTADLSLTAVDAENPEARPDVWEKVARKLRGRTMPPAPAPKPDDATYNMLADFLETRLDAAAEAQPDPGRTVSAHRLNRAEYANAIRDLLALDIDTASMLPSDDSGGFDNLGALLSVSPGLMERYLSAAGKISRLAVGDTTIKADVATYPVSPFLVQGERMNEDLPFGSRGGLAVKHNFPLDGEYKIKIRLQRTDGQGYVIGIAEPNLLDVRVDNARVKLFTIGGESVGLSEGAGAADAVPPDYNQSMWERNADDKLEVSFQAKAGTRLVQVAFLKERWAPEGAFPERNYESLKEALVAGNERSAAEPTVSSVAISGPFNASGSGETPSRKKIFICKPANAQEESPCARKIISSLARLAYRRPVNDADVNPLMTLYEAGRQEGQFEHGIQNALEGMLVSTEFVFRIQPDPPSVAPGSVYQLGDLNLASRLSFFLWSSIPDDELLTVAEQGKLKDPKVLEAQVRRMLADKKSTALVDNFAGQWLLLRNVKTRNPNRDEFPDFDETLRNAFETETNLFLKSIMREDRSVIDIVRADYTFLNDRLARHYGIPGVYGNQFRRVTLTDPNRRGLLGQGSILTVTSYANRTSVVLRGKWVLENMLGSPPPAPPPNVPPLKEKSEGAKGTMRQQMEEHRKNPACQGCHARMDPIGFALENFNAVGEFRAVDDGLPIDPSGVLPDGSKFDGIAGLREAMLKRPDLIAYSAAEKLLMYSLGRGLEANDAPALRKVLRESAKDDYRWSSLVIGIVKSTPFQMRRARTS